MWSDLQLATRSLGRSPVFSATAILTLALGIGASTALFSIVHAVLLRPLPYREPDRLVRVWESNPSEANAPDGGTRALVSAANFNDWRSRSRAFDDLALFEALTAPTVLGVGEISLQAQQAVVSQNFFGLLGLQPALGRGFDVVPEARGPLDGREVILSHAFWRRVLGGDPAAIGRTIRIEGAHGSVVVGVMPAGFSFPERTDFWTPMDTGRTGNGNARRDMRLYGAIGRLAANVSVEAARADLEAIAGALAREHPASNARWTVTLLPVHESIVGGHRLALLTLFAAVAFVMLLGCANVSNLLLSRGIARRGELAVRAALGASRARIVRLLLAETIVLALIGGAAGLAVASLLLPVLVHLAGDTVPRLAGVRTNMTTLAFSGVSALLAIVVTGLIPALRQSRTELQTTTAAEGERTTRLKSDTRVQRVIVAGELAVCLVLLVGAMLFARTFMRLEAVDLGFDPEQVISIETRVPLYRTLARNRWQLLSSDATDVLARMRRVPGVAAASATSDLPLAGNQVTTEVALPGETRARQALYHRVSPDYFRTMGMTLVRGRDFTNEDMSDLARLPDPRAAVPREGAVIVNETTARMFWPSGDAAGQFLSTNFDARPVSRRRVVGVVRDARSESIRGGPPAEVYVPYLEDPSFAMTLLVRTALPPDRIVPILRRELRAVSADMSTANVRPLDEVVADSLRSSRFSAFVMGLFAAAALSLSALGVFGVFAFGIATRIREIGIRMALGATGPDIARMFLRQAAGPIAAGLVLGTAGALALGRLVSALLFGVVPTDVVSYAAAASMLAAVALLASYLPVRRVLQSDPSRALRLTLSVVGLLSVLSSPIGTIAAGYDPMAVSSAFVPKTVDLVVKDASRQRDIPVRIHLPDSAAAAPIVLFSHGLGGSRESGRYLGVHWAARGYVGVFLQHPGSDESVWQDAAAGARDDALRGAASARNLRLRVQDVAAVIDQLERWSASSGHQLSGRLAMNRLGMSGHSFGALTTQAVSGQRLSGPGAVGGGAPPTDARIKAAVIFSPSSPRAGDARTAFGGVKIPWLLMTGTDDVAPIGDIDVASRLAVFPALPPGDKYELVLQGAAHSAFGDRALPGDRGGQRNPNHHRAIMALSTAFWDTYLRDDAAAQAWLTGDGAAPVLQPKDRWQAK